MQEDNAPVNHVLPSGESVEENNLRFQLELEFVNCLANPKYLNCKAWKIKNELI